MRRDELIRLLINIGYVEKINIYNQEPSSSIYSVGNDIGKYEGNDCVIKWYYDHSTDTYLLKWKTNECWDVKSFYEEYDAGLEKMIKYITKKLQN